MCDIYITFIYCSFFKNLYGGIMRVISGKYKGKKIDGFDIVGTRPTMDRVKESLFGMIQNYLQLIVTRNLLIEEVFFLFLF